MILHECLCRAKLLKVPLGRLKRSLNTPTERHLLTPMYNCARIKLTAPRDGCKLWSMRFIM